MLSVIQMKLKRKIQITQQKLNFLPDRSTYTCLHTPLVHTHAPRSLAAETHPWRLIALGAFDCRVSRALPWFCLNCRKRKIFLYPRSTPHLVQLGRWGPGNVLFAPKLEGWGVPCEHTPVCSSKRGRMCPVTMPLCAKAGEVRCALGMCPVSPNKRWGVPWKPAPCALAAKVWHALGACPPVCPS